MLGLWTYRKLWATLLAAFLATAAIAEESARSQIEARYTSSVEALQLRFYDGAVSFRAPFYQATSPEGRLVDLRLEREKIQDMLKTAIEVKEKLQILSYKQESPTKVSCQIQDKLDVIMLDRKTNQLVGYHLSTRSTDTWEFLKSGWRMVHSKIEKQDLTAKVLNKSEASPASAGKK